MPRRMRIHYYGAFYHVMLRGNFRNIIFKTDDDRLYLYKLFDSVVKTYACWIHVFCLMNNHIHLVIEVGHIPLRKIMQSICSRYAGYFNRSLNRVGHLFQGRYKAKLVTDDKYLLELCYYIHHNPKSAGIVNDLKDYRWSSHHVYRGYENFEWLKSTHILELIKKTANKNGNSYEFFISHYDKYFSKPMFCVFDDDNKLIIVDSLAQKSLQRSAFDFNHVGLFRLVELICQYLNLSADDARSDRRSDKMVLARNLITYFAHYRSRHFLCDIAHYLNRSPDAISKTLNRFLFRSKNDKSTQQMIKGMACYLEQMVRNDPTI